MAAPLRARDICLACGICFILVPATFAYGTFGVNPQLLGLLELKEMVNPAWFIVRWVLTIGFLGLMGLGALPIAGILMLLARRVALRGVLVGALIGALSFAALLGLVFGLDLPCWVEPLYCQPGDELSVMRPFVIGLIAGAVHGTAFWLVLRYLRPDAFVAQRATEGVFE